MSNVIKFPARERTGAEAAHRERVAKVFHDQSSDQAHAVQFYDDESFLFDTVGHFLAAGLLAGDGVIVIAREHHRRGFQDRLVDLDVEAARATGQLVMVDADETLASFMIGDMPDEGLFQDTLARLMATVNSESQRPARVRAYGEMVDILWREGNSSAAIRLEELWNAARERYDFSLLCAYLMGQFYNEGDAARFMAVCRSHSHVMPAESFADVEDASARLREIALLQQHTRSLEYEVQHRKQLERALRSALEECRRSETSLRASLKREQDHHRE